MCLCPCVLAARLSALINHLYVSADQLVAYERASRDRFMVHCVCVCILFVHLYAEPSSSVYLQNIWEVSSELWRLCLLLVAVAVQIVWQRAGAQRLFTLTKSQKLYHSQTATSFIGLNSILKGTFTIFNHHLHLEYDDYSAALMANKCGPNSTWINVSDESPGAWEGLWISWIFFTLLKKDNPPPCNTVSVRTNK